MLGLLLSLPFGCFGFVNTVGDCDDVGVVASGTVSFDATEREGSADSLQLETDSDGACLTAVTATIEFGQGCSIYLQADGGGDRLPIFDMSFSGEDGCGFDEVGWSVADYRDSAVLVAGDLQRTDSDQTFCHDGTVTVVLDLGLQNLAGDTADVVGELVFTGVEYANVDGAVCD